MKNAFDGLIGRVNIVEETISELGDRSIVTKLKCKKKKEQKAKQMRISKVGDDMRRYNIFLTEMPKGEQSKTTRNILSNNGYESSKLMTDIRSHIQDAQRISRRINIKKNTCRISH